MSWFSRIEERCATFIERAFANMFPSDLEPAQIARKLVATMEARTQMAQNEMSAPGGYTVCVNPADFERLAPHRAYLQKEWSALLADVAERVGIRFAEPPRVQLRPKDAVVPGAIDVEVREDGDAPREIRYHLRVLKGAPIGETFAVNGATRVGRNAQCEIFLVDPSVSRNHALLDVREGNLLLRDAGSTNGTFVNGERVATRALRSGDIVAFGKTQLRVETAQP